MVFCTTFTIFRRQDSQDSLLYAANENSGADDAGGPSGYSAGGLSVSKLEDQDIAIQEQEVDDEIETPSNSPFSEAVSEPDSGSRVSRLTRWRRKRRPSHADSIISTTSGKRPTRLERSLHLLEDAIHEFERVYADYGGKLQDYSLDVPQLNTSDHATLSHNIFDTAAALEERIDETLNRRDAQRDQPRRKSVCGFVSKLYPLATILLDVGSSVAQSLATAQRCPKDMLANLDSISYQANRLTCLRGLDRTESVTEKSMDLLTAIMRYYSACLTNLSQRGEDIVERRSRLSLSHITVTYSYTGIRSGSRGPHKSPGRRFGGVKQDHILCEWLSPSHWEVIGQLTGHMDRYLGGTLNWLYSMPELNSWFKDDENANTLWITGLPGIGKSVIAAQLVNILHISPDNNDPRNLPRKLPIPPNFINPCSRVFLTFFFCKDGENKLMYAHNIIQTISFQLARQSETFRREVDKARENDQFTVSQGINIRLLYHRLLEQPLQALSMSKEFGAVSCIIDGLDEADFTDMDGRSSKIAILLQLLSGSSNIHLLVLSRQIHEISEAMSAIPGVKTREISAADNGADIDLYVGWTVSKSKTLQEGFERLNISPVTHFRDSSRGNFLWTDVVLRFLERSTSHNDFESGLSENPAEFYELYHQILRRIKTTAAPRMQQFIKQIIHATIASPRELEVAELQSLVEETLNDRFFDFPSLIRAECGTFLRLVGDAFDGSQKYAVQVVHQTFRDFITSDDAHAEEFHVSLPESHRDIAIVLLRYLCLHEFGAQLMDGNFVDRNEHIAKQVSERFPLLKYAASQWSFHLRHSLPTSSPTLNQCVETFLTKGPLLLWIETLAIFSQLSAVSRTRDDTICWGNTQASGEFPFEPQLFEKWARDTARLCKEYLVAIFESPNSVYGILFDLFPSPSLFWDRYKNGTVSVSGGLSLPLNPAIVGVSNLYSVNYDLCAFSHGYRKLFGLANTSHIRVARQAFGDTVNLIRAPGVAENNKWAILAMAFSPSKVGEMNWLAAVHIPLDEFDSPYRPELSIWDLDTDKLRARTPLKLSRLQDQIYLVDTVQFSDDMYSLHCGPWTYNIHDGTLDVKVTESWGMVFSDSDAVIVSPNCLSVLLLRSENPHTLFCSTTKRSTSFNKPQFYESDYGTPHDPPAREPGWQRYQVAPFMWWQLWREATRAYRFSSDSRWFARCTEQNSIVLHDLENMTERVIYQPPMTWSRIVFNNLAFDAESERLAWTYNHIHKNSIDTRIQMWSTKLNASIGGFQLGRYGWRERIEFCFDQNHILTYRMGIAIWDISLGLEQDSHLRLQTEPHGWILGRFTNDNCCIRLGYRADAVLFALFPEEPPSDRLVLQSFDRGREIAKSIAFDGELLRRRYGKWMSPRWGFHWVSDGNIFACGNTMINVTDPMNMSIDKTINISARSLLIDSAFHITASLFASLHRNIDRSLILELYSTRQSKILNTHTFQGYEYPLESGTVPCSTIMLFDPAPEPSSLIVLVAQPNDIVNQANVAGSDDVPPGPVQVWIFDLFGLAVKNSFELSGARWEDPDTFVHGYITADGGTVICCEDRKYQGWCRLWIIDVKVGAWKSQLFPGFRQLIFVQPKETIVALTDRGFVQIKSLESMEADILRYGNGLKKFNDSGEAAWVLGGWRKIVYLPPSFQPCFESGFAVHDKGELAYIGEFGKRLVQISFQW